MAVEIRKITGGRHRGVNVGDESKNFRKCLLIKTTYKYARQYEKTVVAGTNIYSFSAIKMQFYQTKIQEICHTFTEKVIEIQINSNNCK